VLVENGGTVVIGGIFELTESDSGQGAAAGRHPGDGQLVQDRTKSTNKQEMLVFITPKMVSDRASNR
jgi:type IV pilus assembly protein PilQ